MKIRDTVIESEDTLLQIARSDPSSAVRRSALVRLRDLGSAGARPPMLEIIQNEHSNENLRETAIKALGCIGIREDLVLLKKIGSGEISEIARYGQQAAKKAYSLLKNKLRKI